MIEKLLGDYSKLIRNALDGYLKSSEDKPYARLIEAMRYSLLAGGKCIRPALVLEFYRQFNDDYEKAIPVACAFEMVHAYSLIHDDLPAMDDDDMRRGKPSCHIAFSEQTALLAGDALQSLAFETALLCDTDSIKPENIIGATLEIARAAGVHGMAGGQMMDLANEGKKIGLDELSFMHGLKTGAMIQGAARAGCVLAGASQREIDAAGRYAAAVGLAFQIVDDILDVTANESELGKPIGSDNINQKSTYVSLLGLKKSKEAAAALTQEAKDAVKGFKYSRTLCELADYLAARRY